MKYFYDTEFLENGQTIELISIGIVAEDGREYYAANSDMPKDRINKDQWLMGNVWPSLPLLGRRQALSGSNHPGILDTTSTLVKPKWVIANEVREFLLESAGFPELWADYCAYDHVVLAQLYGRMIRLPEGIPMFTNDLQQLASFKGTKSLPEQVEGNHNALEDARHVKVVYEYLEAI